MFSDPNKSGKARLSVRLGLWHSAISLAAVLAVLALIYVGLRKRMEEQDRDAVLFRLNQYSAEYSRAGLEGVINLAALRKGRANRAVFVRIALESNRTVFERDVDDWAEFDVRHLEQEPVPESPGVTWRHRPSRAGYDLLLATTVLPDGTIVQVGKSNEESFSLLKQFRIMTLVAVAVAIPLNFLGGAFLANRALRPLRSLTNAVREIQETARFSMRAAETGSGDELDGLAKVFNAAMTRIETLLRSMRESLDNVAHDLRTPMTRLRNRAQNCLERGGDPAAQREALISCVEESDHMLAILDTLMDIAEIEAGITRIEPVPVRVKDLALAACDLYQEVAEEREVTLGHSVPDDLQVVGDRVFLQRVLANLIDNAIKYNHPGGSAGIRAMRVDDQVKISVWDTGPGIAEEDMPKIWERLFRGDKSRSERGLGLGLSFVRAMIIAHGGSVSVACPPGSGCVFSVLLPTAVRTAVEPATAAA